MFSVREIFHIAMKLEENGEAFYRKAIEKIRDHSIRSLLQWLAEEEIAHREWFAQRAGKVRGTPDDTTLDERSSKMIQDIIGDQTFSLGEADLSEMNSVEEIFQLAIEFEEDTIIFFNMMATLIGDKETIGELNAIIEEEKRHVTVLKEKIQEDAE